jgi:hypothetical protein
MLKQVQHDIFTIFPFVTQSQREEGGAFYKSLITESPLLVIPAPVFTGLNSSRNPHIYDTLSGFPFTWE